MHMKVLVCNVGSTSLKFKLYEMPEKKVYATAKVERVGSESEAIYSFTNIATGEKIEKDHLFRNMLTVSHFSFLTCLMQSRISFPILRKSARLALKPCLQRVITAYLSLTKRCLPQ